jgi:hypothetical protein
MYSIVDHLMNQSGFAWSTEQEACVELGTATVWAAYVQAGINPSLFVKYTNENDRNIQKPRLSATKAGHIVKSSKPSCQAEQEAKMHTMPQTQLQAMPSPAFIIL